MLAHFFNGGISKKNLPAKFLQTDFLFFILSGLSPKRLKAKFSDRIKTYLKFLNPFL